MLMTIGCMVMVIGMVTVVSDAFCRREISGYSEFYYFTLAASLTGIFLYS